MAAKILMLKGLPGSGKSTWAAGKVREFAEQGVNACVVNKDAIRREFETSGWTWSKERENDVIAERDRRVIKALESGFTVIVDDTNLARKHKVRLEQIAQQFKVKLETQDFLKVPLEVCLERNAQREGKARVPDKVITDMWEQFVRPQVEVELRLYVPDLTKPKAIICDLDGTLADYETKGHRGPFDATRCEEDDLVIPVATIVTAMRNWFWFEIIFLSGREDVYRPQTQRWLNKTGFGEHTLFMRKAKDFRKDWIVKAEIFDAHIRDNYNVIFCLDDRNQVVEMWRKLGLTCLQVREGNF